LNEACLPPRERSTWMYGSQTERPVGSTSPDDPWSTPVYLRRWPRKLPARHARASPPPATRLRAASSPDRPVISTGRPPVFGCAARMRLSTLAGGAFHEAARLVEQK
jgi:hypothetical protein